MKRHPLRTATRTPETIGVMIPTFRRTADLLRCLESFKYQILPADDILLIVRVEDLETQEALTHFDRGGLPIRIVLTDIPGTVAAHNIGIDAMQTDVLAMIDDDTVPHPVWLQRILADFQADPHLGGLAGRDCLYEGGEPIRGRAEVVGKLQWFGRAIGNHHLGFGKIRSCELLKGANMSYRAEALARARCDVRLRGRGAQPNEDVSLAMAFLLDGWNNAYDPEAKVDHFSGARQEERHYGGVGRVKDSSAFIDFSYNEVVGIWDYLSVPRRIAFSAWSVLVGTRVCPGLVQAVRWTRVLGKQSWYRFWLAQRGKWSAIWDFSLLNRLWNRSRHHP